MTEWPQIRKGFEALLSNHQQALKAYENIMNKDTEKAVTEAYSSLIDFVRQLAGMEEFESLPVLDRDEDYMVRSMGRREIWRRSAMSEWAQAAVISLEEKGLLCEDEFDPDTIYITNAGKAYVEGRRLPKIVIPPYNE